MRLHFVAAIVLAAASPCWGQQIVANSNINIATTPVPGSGHDYIKMLQETVNPANGSVSIRIEAPVPRQRGDENFPYYIFGYDSSGVSLPTAFVSYVSLDNFSVPSLVINWIDNTSIAGGQGPAGLVSGGFVANAAVGQIFSQYVSLNTTINESPFLNAVCEYNTGFVFVDPYANRHSLNLSWLDEDGEAAGVSSQGCSWFGSSAGALITTAGDTQYQATLQGTPGTPSFQTYIADAHGRGPLADTNGNCCGFSAQTTMVGNEITSVTIPGLANPYTITYGTTTGTYTPTSTILTALSNPTCPALPAVNSGKSVVKSITLPNLQQSYTFMYGTDDPTNSNPYGLLSKITYPTSAWVKYSWAENPASESLALGPSAMHCEWQHGWPVIVKRIVSFDGTTPALEQDFSYPPTNWGSGGTQSEQWVTKTTVVTTKNLLLPGQPQFTTTYTYSPIPNFDFFTGTFEGQSAVESTIVYNDWGGSVLQTVSKNWNGPTQMASQCQTLPTGLTSGIFYKYTPSTTAFLPNVMIDKKEFDYGLVSSTACQQGMAAPTGTATRETSISYQPFPPTPYFPTVSILDRPCKTIIYDSTGLQAAETDELYDGGTTVCGTPGTPSVSSAGGSSIMGHYSISYGVSSTFPRGNVTRKTEWANTGASPVTNYTYDETGQVTSVQDPNLNVTQYSFADNFVDTDATGFTSTGGSPPSGKVTNTYLTKITYPPTNGVTHIENYSYGYNDGELTTASDQNQQVTTNRYNDPLGRLTETDYPDAGNTIIGYSDAGPSPSITTKKLLNSSGATLTNEAIMDGMGHLTHNQLSCGSSCTNYTDTTYDGLGRKYTVTNAYRSTGDPTYGITTYTYDALGRITSVKNPDNSTVQTTYTGRAVEVSDEGNGTKSVQRISQSDALGRLKSVCEISSTTLPNGTGNAPLADCGLDISAKGFLTSYSYDILGNLTNVSQGSLAARSFSYNSLSQLLSSTNPEANTAPTGGVIVPTTYAYDPNGNLINKVEPAQNQTGTATVTLTYCYDALNRMTAKGYSLQTCTNGNLHTPAATYVFDKCPTTGCPTGYPASPNVTGRLVESYTSNARTFNSYDPLGRTENQWQCVPQNCGTSYFALPYTYDPGGDLLTATNGQGVTFNYAYDAAAQLTGMTSSLSDANHPGTLISAMNYNGPGSLTSASLGNGLSETLAYSDRTRLQALVVATSGSGGTFPTGSVTIGGTEKTTQSQGTHSTATIDVASSCTTNCGSGIVAIIINGVRGTASWSSSLSSEAAAIATAASNTGLVSATSGNVTSGVWKATLTSIAYGASTDYSLSCSAPYVSPCPSSMTGGSNGTTTYDTGSVSITVDGFLASTTYGSTSTSASVASALATALNSSTSPVTATASNSVVSITSKVAGIGADYSLSASSLSNNPGQFNPPSFSGSPSGSNLAGGSGGSSLYSVALTYAPNGNVLSANDSVNGNWTYTYDDFNRLLTSTQAGGFAYTHDYDRYGNRWHQYLNGACTAGTSFCLTFDTNNRINSGAQSYDTAGNVIADSMHHYYYDAENRLIQVDGIWGTCTTASACYVYDADGQRVEKTVAGASVYFLYDLAGHPFTEINSSGAWDRNEVYADGEHLATYSGGTGGSTYFIHSDWLGTERVRTNIAGVIAESCTSLPFGDGMTCAGNDISPLHFTGKERDPESGLDNFVARYDASSMGRFMTPDPLGGHLEDPQTLNKYAYVRNNPTTLTDPTGLDIWLTGCGKDSGTCQNNYVGTTDKDGNFTRTHLTGDQTSDATLGAHGITVTQDGQKYQGVWDTNKGENGAVTVAGAAGTPLEGYDAKVTGNCGNTCVASGSIFNASNPNASTAALFSVLDAKGSGYVKEAGLDAIDKFHSGATNFRGHTKGDPHGIPSTHIPIDPKASTPQLGFHIDRSFPYDSPGDFAEHTGSVIHTLWNQITGQQ